jgi:hypothetical protein
MLGAGLASQGGCRGRQTAQVMQPGEADMVGSHSAGSATYKPLIDQAVGRLLGRHSQGIQPASFNAGSPGQMRVCFVGVENKSAEELGDFKDQIYELIDTKVVQSGVYKMISGRYVDAGLRQSRLRPDELFIPSNTRTFAAVMEQMQQPFDFLLYAKITSGTTTSNKDYQRDYLLTLEMVDMRDGSYDKESARLRKGYNRSLGAKIRNFNPF